MLLKAFEKFLRRSVSQSHRKFLSPSSQILIELLISLVIFAVVIGGVVLLVISGELSMDRAQQETRALALASEGVEAVMLIRENSFDSLQYGSHGLVLEPDGWILKDTQDKHDNFTRQLIIDAVKRNVMHEFADSGVEDPDTRKIKARVTWGGSFGSDQELEIPIILTRWSSS